MLAAPHEYVTDLQLCGIGPGMMGVLAQQAVGDAVRLFVLVGFGVGHEERPDGLLPLLEAGPALQNLAESPGCWQIASEAEVVPSQPQVHGGGQGALRVVPQEGGLGLQGASASLFTRGSPVLFPERRGRQICGSPGQISCQFPQVSVPPVLSGGWIWRRARLLGQFAEDLERVLISPLPKVVLPLLQSEERRPRRLFAQALGDIAARLSGLLETIHLVQADGRTSQAVLLFHLRQPGAVDLVRLGVPTQIKEEGSLSSRRLGGQGTGGELPGQKGKGIHRVLSLTDVRQDLSPGQMHAVGCCGCGQLVE